MYIIGVNCYFFIIIWVILNNFCWNIIVDENHYAYMIEVGLEEYSRSGNANACR